MGKLTEYYAILNSKNLPSKDYLYWVDLGDKEKKVRRKYRSKKK